MPDQPSYSVPLEQGAPFYHHGTNPPAGHHYLFDRVNYPHLRVLIEHVRFTLTTDANVADRRINLVINNPGTPGTLLQLSNIQLASLGRVYHLRPQPGIAPVLTLGNYFGPLYDNLLVDQTTFSFLIQISNIQGGDQISGIVIHGRQWVEREV